MPATEAQKEAARRNGAMSRGPVSAEGKARSRMNSTRHGMAADDLVPPEDRAEVDRRALGLLREMGPKTIMGRYHVGRIARLTVRVERCADAELAANQFRADHAVGAFDDARLAEAEHALSWIAAEPATHARRLRATPEGIDLLVARLLDLRDGLDYPAWDYFCGDRVANLMGVRMQEAPGTRILAMTEAINGNFDRLMPAEGEGLTSEGRSLWAREEMARLIDEEVARLREHRETLDLAQRERDRALAPARAGFDPSKEAILARRYEAAAEKALYRALREYGRAEAGTPDPAEGPGPGEAPGSFGNEDDPAEGVSPIRDPEPVPALGRPRNAPDPASETGPNRADRVEDPVRGPA